MGRIEQARAKSQKTAERKRRALSRRILTALCETEGWVAYCDVLTGEEGTDETTLQERVDAEFRKTYALQECIALGWVEVEGSAAGRRHNEFRPTHRVRATAAGRRVKTKVRDPEPGPPFIIRVSGLDTPTNRVTVRFRGERGVTLTRRNGFVLQALMDNEEVTATNIGLKKSSLGKTVQRLREALAELSIPPKAIDEGIVVAGGRASVDARFLIFRRIEPRQRGEQSGYEEEKLRRLDRRRGYAMPDESDEF